MFSVYAISIIIVRSQHQYRSKSIIDHSKEDVYEHCRSFAQRNSQLQTLLPNHSPINIFEDVYLLIDYSPKNDDQDELYLQMATSYLLLDNLQQLSREQQIRTHVLIFLRDISPNATQKRLARWFRSIYTPYTATTDIIRMQNDNQSSREWIINYTKSKKDISLNAILFFLEDDYIFDTVMLIETIEFFISHDPCFIVQVDHSDRCRLVTNDGFGHVVVPGRTRLWRSIPFFILPFVCRLKTLRIFDDLISRAKDAASVDQKLRSLVGDEEILYCAIPSYSARIETLLLSNDINISPRDDMAMYYKDWWTMARHALAKAQMFNAFPYPKMNARILFA